MNTQLSAARQQRIIPRKYYNKQLHSRQCVYREAGLVLALDFFFPCSSHCVCNNSDLFTTAIPPPRRCRLMKEKIGSGETEVSFRGFFTRRLIRRRKIILQPVCQPGGFSHKHDPLLSPPVDITLCH